MISSNKIRKIFLKFFKKKNHKIFSGNSLLLNTDKSLLFANAGMNQFKKFFLGNSNIKYSKIATIQYCLRTGGKHNDINQVGNTNIHHTFFEMLGNFSFGSYFKKEAILYAWELLTHKKWFNINKKKLLITVYYEDIETYKIWKNIIKISKNRIIKVKDKKNKKFNSDNFWKMGKYGLCGPSTEIFYDYFYKNKKKCKNFKDFKSQKNRFLEIWNIVFIQFNKTIHGKIEKLPIFSIDTGMGLERISAVLQKVNSNYDTDIFKNLIQHIIALSKNKILNKSTKIIADHFRAICFIISDHILPSNEEKGYILRKIIRRAVTHGFFNKIKNPFLYKLLPTLIKSMKSESKKICKNKKIIIKILKKEEKNFLKILKSGLNLLKIKIKKLKNNKIKSNFIFYLYDTLGFPIDITIEICKKKKIYINIKKLKKYINNQKKKSNNKNFKNNKDIYNLGNKKTKFLGYKKYKTKSIIKKIFINYKKTKKIKKGEKAQIILDKTVFYGKSGGQIGDSGLIKLKKKNIFKVKKTKKIGKIIVHIGKMISGKFLKNSKVILKINKKKRNLISINHTCTHLLNYALQKILKKKIYQKGSSINSKKIRFDFLYEKKINFKKQQKIEKEINKKIRKNYAIKVCNLTLKKSKKLKYKTIINKKYNKHKVRGVKIGSFSKELCGGTHVHNTKEINVFIIKKIIKIASNTYRIKAVTNKEAIKKILKNSKKINSIKNLFNCNSSEIVKICKKKLKIINLTYKNIKIIEQKYIKQIVKNLIKKSNKKKKIYFICKIIKNINIKLLRKIINKIKENPKIIVVALINQSVNNTNIIINVKKKFSKYIQANKILKKILNKNFGKGGGNLISAEGGFTKKNIKLNKIIKNIKKYLIKKLIKFKNVFKSI
ncbi:alanine--tRNA ligase [Buchnera aphidicola]|uniref:alanine--tRNA ligase n=1 Tax=Buchnera aphidicola TaxID=9 RepID=UPI0030EF1950